MQEYYPDEKLKRLWNTILLISFSIFYGLFGFILLITYAIYQASTLIILFLIITLLEIPVAICFYIWIPHYFRSIKYLVSDDFVRIQGGVVWKNFSTVPFEKIQNVEIHQGPIERNFGLGRILLHTAGYSGPAHAEGIIKGVVDFQKLASFLTEKVKIKTASEPAEKSDLESIDNLSILISIRDELIEIRNMLSNR